MNFFRPWSYDPNKAYIVKKIIIRLNNCTNYISCVLQSNFLALTYTTSPSLPNSLVCGSSQVNIYTCIHTHTYSYTYQRNKTRTDTACCSDSRTTDYINAIILSQLANSRQNKRARKQSDSRNDDLKGAACRLGALKVD